jgi:hypothetical protein
MNEKIKIRKVSDWWGEYNCSSNRNLPIYVEWLPKDTTLNYDFTIYVDHFIGSDGLRDPSPNKLGWLLESPQMNKEIIKYILDNLNLIKKHYKYIFTCVESLVNIGEPFVYSISNAVPWIWQQNRKIHPKTELVSMISSTKNWLPGHAHRLEWVEKLKDKVHLFGSGRPNQLKDKEDGIKNYMFSVSIENDNSDSYFCEKLTDNFVMGTVPVYWGSKKAVEKYFDSRGVIFLEDDPTLSSLSKEKYESMMPYIENNFNSAMSLPISEDYIYEKYLINKN